MTLVVRRISATKAWKNTFERNDLEGAIPSWCFGEFIPTARDDGGLSVFELDSADSFWRLNGAYALTERIDGELLWVGTDRKNIDKANLKLSATAAGTFDPEVNGWHREIAVPEIGEASALTELFARGDVYRFNQKQRDDAVAKTVAEGNINLERAFKRSDGVAREQLIKLIESNALQLVPRK